MSYQFDVDLSANDRVNAWLLGKFQSKYRLRSPGVDFREWCIKHYGENNVHLAGCSEAAIEHPTGSDGSYGCDTGCEYARLECTVKCTHGFSTSYEYGEFGELADMLEEIG